MLAAQLTQLHDGAIPALAETLAVVDGADDTLTAGLARLDEPGAAAWAALAGAVGGTPLAARVTEAAGAVRTGALTEDHLAALAGARSALLGAAHDALLDRLDTALGRSRAPWAATPAAPAASLPALAGARAWLHELALAGWRGADHELLS
ncbi:hypothetical protein AB0F93_28475, partial [Micromonospora tulbaghiae]